MIISNNENKDKHAKVISQTLQEKNETDFCQHFLVLHPSDQVDVFVSLEEAERQTLYEFLAAEEFAVVFSGLYFIHQEKYFQELPNEYFSEMLNEMFTDDVVHFLKWIDDHDVEEILRDMNEEKAENIRLILQHDLDAAGAVMTSEYITTSPKATVAQTLEKVRREETDAEIVYYTYVVDDEGKLQGVISLKRLITSSPTDVIEAVMDKHIVSVPSHMEQIDVSKVIQKYDLLAIPVVTEEYILIGIITVDDVMDIIELQTTKSFGEFSAVKNATDEDASAFQSAKKRAPWIIFLMFAGLVTSGVIGRFEDTLESVVILAAFMPMLMDSGGNVGTQSLAVSVRGLALGTMKMNNIWRMILKEITTGFLIGVSCMVLIIVLILILYGNLMLGVVVGVSILITLTIAAMIGLIFPLILNKLNFDPAIASGPFITTINDIFGLMIYFSIATMFMQYL